MKNYYEILGVKRDAASEEIKHAYRNLVKKFHPDANNHSKEAKEQFQAISEAYQVLSNEESRKQYDSWGHTAYRKYAGQAGRYTWQEDEDYSRENGHCGACQTQKDDNEDEPPPHSIRVAVKMSYQEIFTGSVKSVEIPLQEPCSSCKGESNEASGKCHTCHGRGYVERKQKVKVRIPARTYERCFYPLADILCEEEENSFPENIIIIVLLKDQRGFERKNYHLYSVRQVSYMAMALGGEIEIPTIEGTAKYHLEPGTRNGARIRLAGQGLWMPPKIGNRGDLYVTLQVEVPKKLNARQRAALQAFWDTMQEDVGTSTQ
ncbi:MAG: DnaJ domain-containing protein [Lachnospiraceae bacterium]|nr:DnaJ domain-containing protein [Lachnospiraceae bacterium]